MMNQYGSHLTDEAAQTLVGGIYQGVPLYPESLSEVATIYQWRKERISHPSGKFDKGGRWYPGDFEHASCCDSVRSPSRAHPYSYMVHCRTRKHIQTWYNEHIVEPLQIHAK